MAKNFVELQRTQEAAIFVGELINFVNSLKNTMQQGETTLAKMNSMWAATDFVDLERRFGVPVGSGALVFGMVRDTMRALKGEGTFADAVALTSRVG